MTEAVTLEEASQTRPKTAGVRTSSGISKKEKPGDAPKTHLESQVEKRETSKMKEREMEETQKCIQQLEHESKHLKSLLSNLHKYVTTDRDANDSSFEVPSEMQTDSTLIAESQQAVAIFQKIKKMERLKFRLEVKEKELNDYKHQQAAYNKELSKCKLQSEMQRQHISDLQQKKDELLNRFSKLAGDRLKHENTNITDLSDADRPTKLSEAFSELYDNEWTDAFEELTLDPRFEDKDAIKSLLDILLTSFQKCREITWERYLTLKTVASTIDLVERALPCVRTVSECEPESQNSLSKSGVNSKKLEHQNPPSQSESRNIKEEAREVTETNHQKDFDTSEDQKRNEVTEEEEAREVTETNHQKDFDTSEDQKSDELEPKDVKGTPKVANIEPSEIENIKEGATQVEVKEVTERSLSKNWDASEDQKKDEATEEASKKYTRSDTKSEVKDAEGTLKIISIETREDQNRNEGGTQLEAIQPSNENGPGDREERETNNLTCATALIEDQEADIKNIWRATTIALKDETVKLLCKLLLTNFDILNKDVPKTSMYLNSCINLCWKMCVQEKPMHLDTDAERVDGCEKTFNLDKFRFFTKSGKGVAFVVWPALFLHEGGAMLTKGVAQGCDESDKRNNTLSE